MGRAVRKTGRDAVVQHGGDTLRDELIEELAALRGIEPEYYDIWGKKHVPGVQTKLALLRAMGITANSDGQLIGEINRMKRPRFVEPVHAVTVGDEPVRFVLNVPVGEKVSAETAACSLRMTVTAEDGSMQERYVRAETAGIFVTGGDRFLRLELEDLAARGPGYYRVGFDYSDGVTGKTLLIVSPGTSYTNPSLKRGWGVMANLHAVRSYGNWGVGDMGDLQKLAKWAAGLGAEFIGTTPLHASPNCSPSGISPYSPISRQFRNYLYIDMRHLPYFEERRYREKLLRLRNSDMVDFDLAASIKLRALEESFASFVERKDVDAFATFMDYVESGGTSLDRFALYMAVAEDLGGDWREWPEEFKDPEAEELKRFQGRALFYKYTQWFLNFQIREAQSAALSAGMHVGLYHDLAVGSNRGGSDTWSAQDIFALDANVGTPPDEFNSQGQNWGFPPMDPECLRESGYEIFINMIRKNLEHGGLLRIDHALGLFRLFWIPKDMEPADGAYVRYHTEEMLHIIALESTRARAMVVAEDLGTVGHEVRDTLKRFGVLSYRLFYFERNYPEPSFVPPERYPEAAFASVNTHDLPTLRGFWQGRDIEVKKSLSLYPDDNALKRDVRNRDRDRWLIIDTLRSRGLLPKDFPASPADTPGMTEELLLAIHRYLAQTPSRLIGVSLDDILLTLEQHNMPGTVDEYPNWRNKTTASLEETIKKGSALADMFRDEGRHNKL